MSDQNRSARKQRGGGSRFSRERRSESNFTFREEYADRRSGRFTRERYRNRQVSEQDNLREREQTLQQRHNLEQGDNFVNPSRNRGNKRQPKERFVKRNRGQPGNEPRLTKYKRFRGENRGRGYAYYERAGIERDRQEVPAWRPADQPSDTTWEKVADWYEDHLRHVDTHHSQTLLPGVTQLLADYPPGRLLDIGCGPGLFSRHFADLGWNVVGIDVSPAMIAKASAVGATTIKYVVGDAETLAALGNERDFDAAISVLALQNIAHADRVFVAASRRLKPGGIFVGVILHPAFRFPRQSAWGWDEENAVLFRRVDRYLSKDAIHIVMHPGADPGKKTTTLHRPISWYVNALADAGLLIERMQEWTSARQSTSGRRKAAENRARQEIPLFLAFRAVKFNHK